MKQSEINIGDWVQNKSDQSIIQIKTHWDIYNAKDFEPVPITPDILEVNGFKHKEYLFDLPFDGYTGNDDKILIGNNGKDWSVNINDGNISIGYMDVQYVHELQHALRLCGIEKEIEL